MSYELVIKRAQLRGTPQLSDIGISGGKIAAVAGGDTRPMRPR